MPLIARAEPGPYNRDSLFSSLFRDLAMPSHALDPLPLEQVRLSDQLCDYFEAGFRTGTAPAIEDLIQQAPEAARPPLLRELLRLLLDHRARVGRPLGGDEGRAQFAGLGPWTGTILDELLPPACVLTVEAGPPGDVGKTFRFTDHATFVVGRDPDKTNFALENDPHFSRTHFLIEVNPPCCRLQDLNSKSGTRVNDAKAAQADLRDGDLISGGLMRLRVHLEGPGWEPGLPATVTLAKQDLYPTIPPPAAGSQKPSSVETDPDWPQVPGYRVEAELGRGGMGVVYRAVCAADGRCVAMKIIRPAIPEPSHEAVERFLREIDVLRRLSHPGIVAFRTSGEAGDGRLWFAMEYVEGRDAGAVVMAEGPLAVNRAVGWTVQLLEALGHAHAMKFVHRDVKPGNLLVAAGAGGAEVVKLADFGLARAYQASKLSGLTMAGTAGGTIPFIPPSRRWTSARPSLRPTSIRPRQPCTSCCPASTSTALAAPWPNCFPAC